MRAVVRLEPPGDDGRHRDRHLFRASRYLALSFDYSVALGAFLAGSLVAESGEEKHDRAPGAAGPRHVRRDLLRRGRHADRSPAHRGALGGRRGVHPAGDRGQDRRRERRGVSRRLRHPHVGADRDEPGADRRVLLHHRRRRTRAAARTRDFLYPVAVAVSAITTLTHAVADPRRGAGRVVGGPQAAPADSELRRALRLVDGELPEQPAGPGTPVARPAPGRPAAARRRAARAPSPWGSRSNSTWPSAHHLAAHGSRAGDARLVGAGRRGARWRRRSSSASCAPPAASARRSRSAPCPPRRAAWTSGAAPRRAFLVTWQLVMVAMVGVPLVALSSAVPAAAPGARSSSSRARDPRDRLLAQRDQPPGSHPGRRGGDRRCARKADGGKHRVARRPSGPPAPSRRQRRRRRDDHGCTAAEQTLSGIYDLIPGSGAAGLDRDRAGGLRGGTLARRSSTCGTPPTPRCW